MSMMRLSAEKKLKRKRDYKRKYYAGHPEYRKSRSEYSKKYRAKNVDELRKKAREKTQRLKEVKRAYDKIYGKSPQKRYSSTRGNAKLRGLAFDLTFNEFMTFWKVPCSYCGSEMENIGLDRVDNEQGYILGNVVSCCAICNMMKRTLPKDIFIAHCHKIVKFNAQ